jgi:hypothetical protein
MSTPFNGSKMKSGRSGTGGGGLAPSAVRRVLFRTVM